MLENVIVACRLEEGRGTGHLMRSSTLARELNAPLLIIGGSIETPLSRSYVVGLYGEALSSVDFFTDLPKGRYGAVVCDLFATRSEELATLSLLGPLIGIDEGGKLRDRFTYLIDCFPMPGYIHRPNASGPEFLNLPPRRREPLRAWSKALVCFGGEDPADIGPIMASELHASGAFPGGVSLLLGAGKLAPNWLPSGVRLIERSVRFKDTLHEYDLVATHFGLSAYEAAASGCSVLLADSIARHSALARAAGFFSLGPKRCINARSIKRALSSPHLLASPSLALKGIVGGQLPHLLRSIDVSYSCILCGHESFRAIARFHERSFFACDRCGMIGQKRHFKEAAPRSYEERYFFEDYKKQYGKTYLEDFPSIEARGKGRIERITRLYPSKGRLLDIGCAYGPFLKAAQEAGWEARGIDICAEAVDYVTSELGIPAMTGDIRSISLNETFLGGGFDAVCLWFVIEHFEVLGEMLSRIKRLLKPGGILAASTPSGSGITRISRPEVFFSTSPIDHYSVWEISKLRKLLHSFGFKLERVVSTGHHPERFPGPLGKTPLAPLSNALSRALRLGDSFEFYARSCE